jgi:chemotaxis protein CheX
MDVNLVNPFIEALLNTLETSSSTRAERGRPYVKKNPYAAGPITGVLLVSGDMNATVSISFSKTGILSIVSRLFGEEMTELNDEIKDAVGEITNMVSGQAANTLAQGGGKYKVGLKTVILEERHRIPHAGSHGAVALPFKTDEGEFTLEFSFERP